MKIKRALFVISLICLFVLCFMKMNEQYDELSRYPYELNEKTHDKIIKSFTNEEINYLINAKIKPEQFLPYMDVAGFDIKNTLYYDLALKTRKDDIDYIIAFVNKYRNQLDYQQLDKILTYYSYNELISFYDQGDGFQDKSILIANLDNPFLEIGANETIFHFEPSKLVSIQDIAKNSIDVSKDILVKKEVVNPLKQLMGAAKEINNRKYGDLDIYFAYLSFEQQKLIYEDNQVLNNQLQMRYPGQNEFQLGYSICIKISDKQLKKLDDDKLDKDKKAKLIVEIEELNDKQSIWLNDNAYKYGFTLREIKIDEKLTYYILRYVGVENATGIAKNEVKLTDLTEIK